MDICIIAPLGLLELSCIGQRQFLLCSLCENEEYVNFYRYLPAYKILDNDVYEKGKATSFDKLLNAAHALDVHEIIVPDVPLEVNKNIELARSFFSTLSLAEFKRFDFMFVPHGKDLQQVKKACDVACQEFRCVSTFGISKLWQPYFDRRPVTTFLNARYPTRNLHLLGLDNLNDLSLKVRSVDTSLPITQAVARCELPKMKRVERVSLTRVDFSLAERRLAAVNCLRLRTWAGGSVAG